MIDYSEYRLWEREIIAFHEENPERLQPIQPEYCVVWENDIDAPCKVSIASPEWWAMALHGGILPPVDAYIRDKLRDPTDQGNVKKEHPYAKPIGPMTPEQAIEYFLMVVLPMDVWINKHNKPKFFICKRDSIPTDRSYRNAWKLGEYNETTDSD